MRGRLYYNPPAGDLTLHLDFLGRQAALPRRLGTPSMEDTTMAFCYIPPGWAVGQEDLVALALREAGDLRTSVSDQRLRPGSNRYPLAWQEILQGIPYRPQLSGGCPWRTTERGSRGCPRCSRAAAVPPLTGVAPNACSTPGTMCIMALHGASFGVNCIGSRELTIQFPGRGREAQIIPDPGSAPSQERDSMAPGILIKAAVSGAEVAVAAGEKTCPSK